MKLAVLLLSAFVTLSAHAQWFAANPQVTVLPGQVATKVYNPYYENIICSGQVFGQLATGQVLTAYFVEQLLQPGTFRFAYVNTTPFNPFINGWATINCRFARYW